MAYPAVPAAQLPDPGADAPQETSARGVYASRAPNVELVGVVSSGGYQTQQWLVQRNGTFIQVTELLYRILEFADGQHSLAAISSAVSSATNRPVSADNLRYLLERRLLPLGLIAPPPIAASGTVEAHTTASGTVEARTAVPASAREGKSPAQRRSVLKLLVRKKVLSPRAINPFTRVLQVFFVPPVLVATLALIAVAQWWVFAVHGFDLALREALFRPELLLVVTTTLLVSGIVHEFGHASALRYGGGQVRGMGVGLYFVYPAFYTDVTDGYRLGRWARLRIDLGGIYFDLILNLVIQALYLITGHEYLLLFVLFNDLAILEEFSPIMRFDGYWTLVDLTGLPDFFALIGPFLRSVLPVPWWKGPKLPPLKRWVKAIFALYCLTAIPILGYVLAFAVKSAPEVLSLAVQELAQCVADLQFALRANYVAIVALLVFRMLIIVLPAIGLLLTLYILLRGTLRVLRRLFMWSLAHPTVWLAVALGALCVTIASSVPV
jgi:putative peptide zinc metalloprotease protein